MEIRLDYATFNFDAGTISPDIIEYALAGDVSLCFKAKGRSADPLMISPFGLSYLPNSGFAPRPHRLQVSGVGCEKFGATLPNLISVCHNNGGECSLSRIDFAFDVLIPKCDWKLFLKSAFCSSIDSTRLRKKFSLSGDGMAMTVYIGSRISDAFFRIYNKSLENPNYIYCENGLPVDVPDDSYIIRYEIELKRHVHHHKNQESYVFDPSPLFFDYYSCDESLIQVIKDYWLSYADEILLPDGFADAEMTLRSKNKNFASISLSAAIESVQDKLGSEPRTFDTTLDYITKTFGKYIPFLVSDFYRYKECEALCRIYCGFVPVPSADTFIQSGFTDIDGCDDDIPWEPMQLEINFNESEV